MNLYEHPRLHQPAQGLQACPWAVHHVQSGAQHAARAGAAGAVVGVVHDGHAHLCHRDAQQHRARERRLRPVSRVAETPISFVLPVLSLPHAAAHSRQSRCCHGRRGDSGHARALS